MQSFIDGLHPAFCADDPAAEAKAVEADHCRRVREQYEALLRGDLETFSRDLADEVEFEIVGPPSVPFLGRWRGRDEVVQAVLRNFAMVEAARPPAIQSLTAQGNQLVVVAREQGRYRTTGAEYDLHWIQVFTFRDGKVVSVREYISGPAA